MSGTYLLKRDFILLNLNNISMSGNQTMINCASLKVGIAIIGVQNIDVQNIEITG